MTFDEAAKALMQGHAVSRRMSKDWYIRVHERFLSRYHPMRGWLSGIVIHELDLAADDWFIRVEVPKDDLGRNEP